MTEITLEKIDIIRERTNASYTEAKEALEKTEGNVVDAIIFIEENKKSKMDDIYTTKDEFVTWMNDLIKKGNVSRIKVKKDDKVVLDIPVNAGIAASLLSVIFPPILAIGFITAVVTKVTIEITKNDGSVEYVNKTIKSTVDTVKDKMADFKSTVKEKMNNKKDSCDDSSENTYQYTVKFDDIDEEKEEVKKEEDSDKQ